MNNALKISEAGLTLIKAYEGFRPVDRVLVSGQRVVGYGHRLRDDRAVHVSRAGAEALLREDLAPFEDMINENIHAPLTQSQYDALCSLAFNIGPRAFLSSDTVRALNNGRILDAANGFDVWRKSEIDGKTYVVDALMRRRAAEKALFLKPEGGNVAASRIDLPPVEDELAALIETNDGFPVYSRDDREKMITPAPYDIPDVLTANLRRREDGPAGILTLTETTPDHVAAARDEGVELRETAPADLVAGEDDRPSPIALAAAKVSDRLDALIEEVKGPLDEDFVENGTSDAGISQAEIYAFPDQDANGPENEKEVSAAKTEETELPTIYEPDIISDTDNRSHDSAQKYIQFEQDPEEPADVGSGNMPYWIMALFGLILTAGASYALLTDFRKHIGPMGDLASLVAGMIGVMLFFGAGYYLLRRSFQRL